MELFDLINNLYSKRMHYPKDSDILGKLWIINSFISMENDLLEYIAFTSKYLFTLGARYYRLLYRLIPQSSSPRNKYSKPKKEFDSILVEKYSTYFEVSKRETRDYLRIMQETVFIEEMYDFVGLEFKK